jgi:putative chitinase
MLTANQFQQAAGIGDYLRDVWYPHIVAAMNKFGINTPLRQAHFIAQVGHESGGFSRIQENLNYSTGALCSLFSRRISKADAERLGRQPGEKVVPKVRQQEIANIIYANRNGNGDKSSGDGYLYRGRGLIQVTGRDNYAALVNKLGVDIVADPDQLTSYPLAAESAAAWWSNHGLNQLADSDDVDRITRIINGGTNGLADRKSRLSKAKGILCST